MWKRTIRLLPALPVLPLPLPALPALPAVSAYCGRCATGVEIGVSKSTLSDKSVCRHVTTAATTTAAPTARTQNIYDPRFFQRRSMHASAVSGAVDPQYVDPSLCRPAANPTTTHHADHHHHYHHHHHHLPSLQDHHQHHHPHHNSEDPKELCRHFLANICAEIKAELKTSMPPLRELSHYLFNEKGKYVRPQIIYLLAVAANKTVVVAEAEAEAEAEAAPPLINDRQLSVCRIAEMIHTASLIHDDIIDGSFVRRGEPTINSLWGELNAVITGDYILSVASHCLSETRDPRVVQIISQVVEDLVRGEFMQLGTKTDETLRFNHYLEKTYRKTASLLANHCKAVALLAGCDEERVEAAFQFGRNIGIAFQLVDDLLDFISTDEALGKPAAADLKLGLATAPVLFALDKHPDLSALIVRRFSSAGDVAAALNCVRDSDGVEQTKFLAAKFSAEAQRNLEKFVDSNHRRALKTLTDSMLHRSS